MTSNFLKLAPFFISAISYLFIYFERVPVTPIYLAHKCTPMISLILFVLSNGIQNSYSKRIFLGLIIAVMGDFTLCFEDYFLIGVALFATTQIIYMTTFGFKPLRLGLALLIYTIEIGACLFFVPKLPSIDLKIILPIYVTLLMTMIWRAMARVDLNNLELAKVLGALGSMSFGFSDLILCYYFFVDKFPYANFYIMVTYYFAQMGIAVSVLSSNENNKKDI